MLEYNCYSLSQNFFFSVLKIFVILDIVCLFSSIPRIKFKLFTLWRINTVFLSDLTFLSYLPSSDVNLFLYLFRLSCWSVPVPHLFVGKLLYVIFFQPGHPYTFTFTFPLDLLSFPVHTPPCPYIAFAHTDWLSQVSYLCLNSSCQEKYWQLTANLLIFIWLSIMFLFFLFYMTFKYCYLIHYSYYHQLYQRFYIKLVYFWPCPLLWFIPLSLHKSVKSFHFYPQSAKISPVSFLYRINFKKSRNTVPEEGISHHCNLLSMHVI